MLLENKHPWKARLGVGVAMLLLAFLGMVVTDVRSEGGWGYWKWMGPVYALLALWLSWYVRKQQQTISPITLGHELLHWLGVNASIFMVSFFVHLGIISRFIAGIFDLTLLSLAIFLAGVYIEPTFLFVGIILGVFAILSAVVVQYLYAVIVPVILAGAIILGIMVWISHQKNRKQNK
jgi:hypothetical protein